jgi:hypothetical protein
LAATNKLCCTVAAASSAAAPMQDTAVAAACSAWCQAVQQSMLMLRVPATSNLSRQDHMVTARA